MIRKVTYSLLGIAALILLLVASSCSRVTYDYNEDVGNSDNNYIYYTPVLFEFNWDDLTEQGIEIPNTMTVVMSRIMHTVHYVYWLDQYGNIIEKSDGSGEGGDGSGNGQDGEGNGSEGGNDSGNGNGSEGGNNPGGDGTEGENGGQSTDDTTGVKAGDGTGDGSDGSDGGSGEGEDNAGDGTGEEPEPENPNICNIDNGEYYVMAIAHGTADYCYEFNGLDGFEDAPQMKMTEISATSPNLTKEDISTANLLDYNPTCPYIHKADPLYFSVEKPEIRLYPESGLTYQTITLKPGKKTLELTFNINIDYEDDIEIESVVAVISGVPRTIQMMNGIITLSDKKRTGKVALEMTETSTGSRKYVGHISTLGLFPADDPNFITGPGIFQVFVKASAMDGENKKTRLLHAGLNIQSTIKEAHIMIQVDEDEKSGYRCARTEAELNIPAKLAITRDLIFSTSGEGLVEWKENDGDINLEI